MGTPIRLKKKYRVPKLSSGGKYTARAGSHHGKPRKNRKRPNLYPRKPLTDEAIRMQNPQAKKLHYTECAVKGYFEQIPVGLRAQYQKMVE